MNGKIKTTNETHDWTNSGKRENERIERGDRSRPWGIPRRAGSLPPCTTTSPCRHPHRVGPLALLPPRPWPTPRSNSIWLKEELERLHRVKGSWRREGRGVVFLWGLVGAKTVTIFPHRHGSNIIKWESPVIQQDESVGMEKSRCRMFPDCISPCPHVCRCCQQRSRSAPSALSSHSSPKAKWCREGRGALPFLEPYYNVTPRQGSRARELYT